MAISGIVRTWLATNVQCLKSSHIVLYNVTVDIALSNRTGT